jgi:hypothetical protein
VKAQIRKEFIDTLSRKKNSLERSPVDKSLQAKLMISLIYHHLKIRGFAHTLSVLVAESGSDTVGLLSEFDVLDTLKIRHIEQSNNSHNNVVSALELLVSKTTRAPKHFVETPMQTDLAGPGIREILDQQIKELHLSYLTRRETERALPVKSVEERMLSYQRECEERSRRDLEAQVPSIPANSKMGLIDWTPSLNRFCV